LTRGYKGVLSPIAQALHVKMVTRVLQTERLSLRHFNRADAPFIFELLNEPSWLQYIGDKGIKTLGDAERYIQDGPVTMYARLGFGLYLVELTGSESVGMCGLIKRDTLENVDLGFAFLSRFWSNGYAYEAAAAVMSYAKTGLGIDRILAITAPNNKASGRLLGKLGFTLERLIVATSGAQDLMLYSITS
jgi:RimJ/RimL family protein N-acetyltransferase